MDNYKISIKYKNLINIEDNLDELIKTIHENSTLNFKVIN